VPSANVVHEALVPTPTIEKLPAAHSPLPLDELHQAWQYDAAGHAVHCALNPLPVTETAHTSLPPMHSQQGSIDRQLLIPLPAICDRCRCLFLASNPQQVIRSNCPQCVEWVFKVPQLNESCRMKFPKRRALLYHIFDGITSWIFVVEQK
jgi:hypothetical protein